MNIEWVNLLIKMIIYMNLFYAQLKYFRIYPYKELKVSQ
jgi:hypothetical protein